MRGVGDAAERREHAERRARGQEKRRENQGRKQCKARRAGSNVTKKMGNKERIRGKDRQKRKGYGEQRIKQDEGIFYLRPDKNGGK